MKYVLKQGYTVSLASSVKIERHSLGGPLATGDREAGSLRPSSEDAQLIKKKIKRQKFPNKILVD